MKHDEEHIGQKRILGCHKIIKKATFVEAHYTELLNSLYYGRRSVFESLRDACV